MNNHPYFDSFAVQEAFDRASREVERQQLIRIVKAQKSGHQERRLQTPFRTELWSSLIARVERTVSSARVKASDAMSWWAKPTEPQDLCC